MQREDFRAMGTQCGLGVSSAPIEQRFARKALLAGRREVEACERALSRFDPESDLSRLNGARGEWVIADLRLVDALTASEWARSETGGLYDPTILPALAAAGYDRSFELLSEREATPLRDWHGGARIEVDPAGARARIEPGAAVDLGGIGKGFSATRALHAMRAAWPEATGVLVDLGGDIALWGVPPEGGTWRIDIADPRTPEGIAGTLELDAGGVATSGRDTRRFGPAGRLHHLIDPRTGVPAASGPLAVTVVAPSTTEAEAHATALAIADAEEARTYVARHPAVGALLIPDTGEAIALGRLPLTRERPATRFVISTQSGTLACN
jgi:thiamine biosynthesis lipoprotein